jgi:hypothetical protein
MAENGGEIPNARILNFQKPIPNEKPNGRKEGAAGFFNESFLLIAPFFLAFGILAFGVSCAAGLHFTVKLHAAAGPWATILIV